MNARSSDRLTIALAQLDPTVGDVAGCLKQARRARAAAARAGADVVMFSELFIGGYPPEDLVLKPAFQAACRSAVETLACETADNGPALLIGAPWVEEGKLYNAYLLHPRRADQQRRPVVGGLARQGLDGGTARGLKRRLEHEVFGRITADEEFGKHHDVGARARRRGAGLPGFLQAAGHVPYGRIELRQRNREAVGRAGIHGLMYARRRDCANRPAFAGPGTRAVAIHVR